MGHPGIARTHVLTARTYWWPGMIRFVTKYCTGCALCQQNKINTHPTAPPLNPIAAAQKALPFTTVNMDFITDLPESLGFTLLLVIVDHDLTKGIVLVPTTKDIDAMGTAQLYHDNVYQDALVYPNVSSPIVVRSLQPRYSKNFARNSGSNRPCRQCITLKQMVKQNKLIKKLKRIYASIAPRTWRIGQNISRT